MRGRCYYTLGELSELTGVSESVLEKDIQANKLKAEKLGIKYRVIISELKKYLSPGKFEDFFNNRYLSEEKIFNIAGVQKEEWKSTLILQSPDWDYVLVFTKQPDTLGEMVKVGLDCECKQERETITSERFISLLQSNQITSVSMYE